MLRVLQWQMRVPREKKDALEQAKAGCEKAKGCGADLLALPEMFCCPYETELFPLRAEPEGGETFQRCSDLARQYGVWLSAGSVPERSEDGRVYNTAYVFDREGACVASYDKTHLFTPMGEHEYFTPGDHLCTFTLDGVKCGLIICYDLRFPELTRSLILQGCDLLFVPAEWPKVRLLHWQTLNRARAIENQIFLACCNGCGTAGETVYGGHSAIYDPWGEVKAEAGEQEEIILADCDFAVKEQIRSSINVFRDRRPEMYKL